MATEGFEITKSETILYEKKDQIAYITLNRQERMNALGRELGQARARALKDASEDPDILVIIFSGAGGRAFSAGADLREGAEAYYEGRLPEDRRPEEAEVRFGETDCPKPIIAAIDGYALGGGLELATRCDIRVATESSRLGMPEVRRGRTSGSGVLMLSRMIPLGEAKWLQFTGSHMTAERAYQIGLIQAIAPDRAGMWDAAHQIANDIKLGAPLTMESVKRIIDIGRYIPPEYAAAYKKQEDVFISKTEDIKEGVTAFAEKRQPVWKRR
jgi:enoyl-CoA hydratase/carnithine racemase